jgi:site-specific DNA recombinase
MLRDPYYVGYVKYKGELIKGRHEPLVSQDLFARVQSVIDARSGSGTRERRHDHFLKGLLWCGGCHADGIESRMIMQWANGHGGKYLYFFCKRKQTHRCDSRYVSVDAAELALEKVCTSLRFDGELAERVRHAMMETLHDRTQTTRLLIKQLQSEMARLDKQEENLIDLVADGSFDAAKTRKKISDLQRRREGIESRLGNQADELETSVQLIERALELLGNPGDLYLRLPDQGRRRMNQAVFEKLYTYEDGVTEVVFKPPFGDLVRAQQIGSSPQYQSYNRNLWMHHLDGDAAYLPV